MTTALVTGGAGFIGSHVCLALLERDWSVATVDNFSPFYDRSLKEMNLEPVRRLGGEVIEGDITDEGLLEEVMDRVKPEVVVHVAAWAGVRPSIENPALYAHVNVVGTQRVIDAAVRNGVERLVVASSSSVYGNNEKVPFSETDDVSHPISPYASTKVATELICQTASHLHGLPISALRFFTVFGPGQRPDLAIRKFMSLIADGKPIPVFGDGSTSRDYTFIDDIVDGVLRAVDRCGDVETYRCYNLGGEHPVRLHELIALIERTIGCEAIVDRMDEQPGDVRRTWADLTRSKAELGYQPSTTIEEGLARQWEWMRSQTGCGISC